MLTISIAIEH